MASLNFVIVLLLMIKVALCCQEDSSIRCALSRSSSLPPPSTVLIHCETDVPDNRLHEHQRIETSRQINYTRWTVDQRPCLLRIGGNCVHIFIRIDSPTDAEDIEVCRIPYAPDQATVCSCMALKGKINYVQSDINQVFVMATWLLRRNKAIQQNLMMCVCIMQP